jgi:hypothetical protein
MRIKAEKSEAKKKLHAPNSLSQRQKNNESASQFSDNRTEAIVQRRIRRVADDRTRAGRKEIFEKFGNIHRDPGLDPDIIGQEEGGIWLPTREEGRARPEDPPLWNDFRKQYHELHSTKLFIQKSYPDLFEKLEGDLNVTMDLLDISVEVKKASKKYKKAVRSFFEKASVAKLKEIYKSELRSQLVRTKKLTDEMITRLKAHTKDKRTSSKILEDTAPQGTEIWREKWHAAILQVNSILSKVWPQHKKIIERWTAKKKEEGLKYMDPALIGELDYIGSLAKGYKSPPKQSVRFQPEKFDVDAKLDAPPLAAFAVIESGAIIDRGRIWSKNAKIPPLSEFETAANEPLEKVEGMDPNEPFEVVIEAKGIDRLRRGLGEGPARNAKWIHDTDMRIRNRIWWLRNDYPKVARKIGLDLKAAGLAEDVKGNLILREHDEKNNKFAYTPDELKQIEAIVDKHDPHKK